MLDDLLRPLKDKLLGPLVHVLGRHVSPNQVTVSAFVIGMLSAISVYFGAVGFGLFLWSVNRIADGLDGAMSRAFNLQTDFGGYLDILLDFTVYAAIPVAFVLSDGTTEAFVALSILLALFYINGASWMYLSALLEKRGQQETATRTDGTGNLQQTSIRMPRGLIGGTETIIFYTLFFLFPDRIVLLFILMTFLTTVTVIQRIVWAVKNLS